MNIAVPELCLIALVGPTGSGKSVFASKHFRPTEVVSSDACRAMVADDATTRPRDAFALLNFITATRLRSGRLILQSQMKQAAFVVALPGPGLVPPSPPRPGQDEIRHIPGG